MHNTASSSTYVPIFTPTVNSRGPSIAPESSARAEQFRRLYDIYRICLQRGEQGRERADRAWSLLVRSGLLDWASNWRDGLDRVQLPGLPPLEHSSSSEGAGVTDSEGNPIPVEIDPEEIEERNSRRNELKTRFLRETLALHSRPAKRVHSLREPRAILLELVLHLISVGQYSAALNEIELYVPTPPYRDDPTLHLYAGMLCIYQAQVEMDRMKAQPHSQLAQSSQTQFRSQSRAVKRRREPSSSSASSPSRSSSSEQEQEGEEGLHRLGQRGNPKRTRKNKFDIPLIFSTPIQHETIQVLEREVPHWCMDARRWFDRVLEIVGEQAEERGEDSDDATLQKDRQEVNDTGFTNSSNSSGNHVRTRNMARKWIDLMDGKIPNLDYEPPRPASANTRSKSRNLSSRPSTRSPAASSASLAKEDNQDSGQSSE